MSTPERFDTSDNFVRLWRNELLRVVHDRLIDMNDKNYVQKLIGDIVASNFDKEQEHVMRNPILFGDYRNSLEVITEKLSQEKNN